MSERDMRQRVVELLRPLDAVSVENRAHIGTPDVNFVEGWAELKWLREWPTGEDTPVVIDHFTPQQRTWLTRRLHRGGNVWLILQCWDEWFLFSSYKAFAEVGKSLNKKELTLLSNFYIKGGIDSDKLIKCLNISSSQ